MRLRTPLVATGAAILMMLAPAAQAGSGHHDDRHGQGHHHRDDLGRQVLGERDGWAAAQGGTTGGAAADRDHVFHVSTWPELQAALGGSGARGDTTARIVYVHGMLDAFDRADGTRATCADFEAEAGFSMAEYIATFDPATWGWEDPAGPLVDAMEVAAAAQARQTQQHVGSNVTIVGVGRHAGITGANLRIRDADNVIVRNLHLADSRDCFPEWDPGDGQTGNWNSRYDNLSVWTSTHVWVDHNTFDSGDLPPSELDTVYGRPYEVHDGLLDITHSSDLVTVSYNEFADHDKTMLIGSSDGRTQDRGTLRVTLHHNHFHDVGQRAPRVRYGQVHVYNNLYTQSTAEGFTYLWGVGRESAIYAENNAVVLARGADRAAIVGHYGGEAMTEVGTRIDGRRASALEAYNAANPDRPIGTDAGWEPTLHERVHPAAAVHALVPLFAGAGVLR